jgi:transcriptional regulator of acetoin/glycerol metabolism
LGYFFHAQSYQRRSPLLDVLDHVQRLVPQHLGEQERHRGYQDAARSLRLRIIQAHLHLLHAAADTGGRIVLLSDIRGFVFEVYGTEHDAAHRRTMPLVPHTLPDLVR